MKVAVLGSGNGGLAVAFEWSQAGHEVHLFDFAQFPKAIAEVAERGGITAEGELTGFAPIASSGHDIAAVVAGAELVIAVGPAYSTDPFAEACRPHAEPGQTYLVCPGSCAGALVMRERLGRDDVVVAETSTLPYAVRLTAPAHLTVYNRLKGGYYLAAVPAEATATVTEMIQQVYPEVQPAVGIWQTTLQNSNPVIHPAVTISNAALIQRTGGDFLFYEEGVTEGVGHLIEAVDRERVALAEALDVPVRRDPVIGIEQGYQTIDDYSIGYSQAPGFLGIRAQPSLAHRYLDEDAGYGLVFLTSLGRQIGVPTPTMDAVLQVASVLNGRDYRTESARTMTTLGLADLSLDELRAL